MDESAAHIAPAVRIVAADDYDVSRHSQVAQGAMETHRLPSLVCDLGLNDEKADTPMRIPRARSAPAKQNDLRVGRSSSQTASCLGDQRLVNCSHDEIVDLAADNSHQMSVAQGNWTRRRRELNATIGHMAIQRLEHVGITVNDLAAAVEFFVELGLEPRGKDQVEGSWVDRIVASTASGRSSRCCGPRTATAKSSW